MAVGTMHAHGLTHGDVRERNILVHNGQPRLVDLESAAAHTCDLRMKVIPGAIEPTVEEFGCAELYDLVQQMCIWRPGSLMFRSLDAYQWLIEPLILDALYFCAANTIKSSIDSAEYLKKCIPKYADGWRLGLEEEADVHYENLLHERLITYGTDNPLGVCIVYFRFLVSDRSRRVSQSY